MTAKVKPLDRLAAEADTTRDPVTVALAGRPVEVIPLRKWRSSAHVALRDKDLDAWASKCLTPEGYATWLEVDPDSDEMEAFFEAWGEATGQNAGE